jgi:tetratricopeptide (TPR) repeat protein
MAQKHRALVRGAGPERAVSLGFVVALALLLGGCPAPWTRPEPQGNAPAVPQSPAPEPAPPAAPLPAPPRPPPPPRENHLSPATRSLVTQAHTLLAHGDIDGASATLDRALRIEPSNPLLWIELGRVRLVDGNAHQAEVCARKALALASGDPATQAQAGRVLADALRAQGRNQEAQQAESKPYMH